MIKIILGEIKNIGNDWISVDVHGSHHKEHV